MVMRPIFKTGNLCHTYSVTVVVGDLFICDRICEKVPFSHTKFDPFFEF